MRSKTKLLSAVSLAVLLTGQTALSANAQQAEDEVITVGTLIKRKVQADRASPIAEIDAGDIDTQGVKTIADLTQTLTINTGAENNPDAFTQGGTTGTTNINLRGLGVQSTLVLLNGRRQVLSAATTNTGYQFVDTSTLVPLIAVENVEILKDGASATYGSDAVAGVVNFSTYDSFDGVKLSGDYQTVDGYDSSEYLLQAMVGKNFDKGNIMGAISYLDRDPLTTAQKRLSRPQDDTSALGNPGAYIPVSGPLAGLPFIDRACADVGGFPQVLGPNIGGLDIGLCGFDFGSYFNLIAEEEKTSAFFRADYEIAEDLIFTADFTYADTEAIRGNSPTFPFLQTGLVLPSHPNYDPTLSAIAPGGVVFFGRAIGNGGAVSPNLTSSETYRFSAQLEGRLDDKTDWRVSYATGENNHVVMTEDTLTDRFRCSLIGNDEATAGALGYTSINSSGQRVSGCSGTGGTVGEFFNPFGTSFSTAPNSQAVLDHVIGTATRDLTSTLDVFEAVVSRDLGDGIALALGAQYRSENYEGLFDVNSNADNFGFLIGDQDYEGDQDIFAVFGEIIYPISDIAELQVAGRYENYDNAGSTFDPKLALLVRPTDRASFRGSISTSFRSPTVYQQFGQGTALVQVTDPANGGATAFIAARSVGNVNLDPETSTAFNLGMSVEPFDNFEIDLDYFNFNFEDVIIPENPQSIINANPTGPQVIRAANGSIIRVNSNYVNASSVDTSGIDFSMRYTLDTEIGTIVPFVSGTYVVNYDLDDPQAGEVSGAGSRNFNNFGTSVPELRFNAGLAWQKGNHSLNLFARHIDSYTDDQNAGQTVDSHTTFDAQYKINLGDMIGSDAVEGLSLTVGAINFTDEDPPQVFTNGGFDSKVHDPRGRLLYIGTDIEF